MKKGGRRWQPNDTNQTQTRHTADGYHRAVKNLVASAIITSTGGRWHVGTARDCACPKPRANVGRRKTRNTGSTHRGQKIVLQALCQTARLSVYQSHDAGLREKINSPKTEGVDNLADNHFAKSYFTKLFLELFSVYSMARTKQLTRPARPSPPRPRPELARMTASSRSMLWHRCKSSPEPSLKKPKKSEMDVNAKVRLELLALELNASNNPCPESTRPRQPPAMTRYHGNMPKPHKIPQKKERHPKSWRKHKVPPTPTDPKMSFPQTSLDDDPPPLTNPGDTHLATPDLTPEDPATRRSEPQTQPEIIDLTGED